MRTARTTATTCLAAALMGTGGAAVAVPAHADPLTCQGQAVTVSGDVGTAGDDVMVVGATSTGGAKAGTGNDLICIRLTTGGREPFVYSVDSGPGDDRVFNESTDLNTRLTTVLGSGADTYVGSDTNDVVVGGDTVWGRSGGTTDVEVDTVDTRGGNDAVYTGSVTSGTRNADRVTLGDGYDNLHWAGDQTGPAVDFGPGSGSLSLYKGLPGTELAVDVAGEVVTADSRPILRWTGDVADYVVAVDNLHTTFTGSDADESLRMSRPFVEPTGSTQVVPPPSADLRRSVDMRGGDDTLVFDDMAGGDLLGGAGDDTIEMGYCVRSVVRLGVTYSCLVDYNPLVDFTGAIDAWEDLTLAGSDLRVVGTGGPDVIDARGFTVRVGGRGGDDVLTANRRNATTETTWPVVVRGGDGNDLITGTFSPDRLVGGGGADRIYSGLRPDLVLGGPGRDVLRGGTGSDTLTGGAGYDKAYGDAGRDRCSAEVRRSCERG